MVENMQPEMKKRDLETYDIVSKRCVEKLYHQNEPSVYKPFVPKFKRRSPLVNRGYWLRMKAVDSAIEAFLHRPTDKKMVVLNLGCGYDPLPFRMRCQKNALGVMFIDIDNKELIKSKVKILTQDNQFQQHLHNDIHVTNGKGKDEDENIIFSSKSYLAVGCELTEINVLNRIFNEIIRDCEILFLTEYSTTYMPDRDIEALLQWAATFEHANFCFLEHCLPDGPDHPFARTMLHRVEIQATPLQISTLADQRDRFQRAGWKSIQAQSLWDFWQNSNTLAHGEMLELNRIEPFHDWEDFALFASHNFILNASTRPPSTVEEEPIGGKAKGDISVLEHISVSEPSVFCKPLPKPTRFGAPLVLSPKSASIHGGTLNSPNSEVYTCQASITSIPPMVSQGLFCHTITTVDQTHHLLVGGRSSSTKVSSRCFVYNNDASNWTRVQDIYPARHRHCATSISIGALQCVLIFGGCTIGGKVLDDWQLWDKDHGWRKLQAESSSLVPRFGSSLIATGSAHGMIMGGMDDTGRIIEEASAWSINDSLSIKFTPISYSGVASVARFGAHLVPSRWGNLLVGGVSSLGVVSKGEEILVLTPRMEAKSLKVFTQSVPRPLLIGSIAVTVAGGDVLIIGGGAACFSFGSIMNMHWYALQGVEHSGNVGQEDIIPHFQRLTKDDLHSRNPLSAGAALKSLRQFQRTKASGNNQTLELHDGPPRRSDSCYSMNRSFLANSSDVTKVSSMTLTGSEAMSDFSQPTLLLLKEGAFARTAEWNIDFLAAKIGHETVVSIHDSQGPHMKFGGEGRNIRYNSLPFGQFKVLLDHGYHCYLRSLNCSSNLEVPADFWSDFPGLRDDFKLPVFLKDAFGISDTTFHSAILRVSGDVTMWVHYDVMSNLLFQVSGSKQVLLFPPEDVIKLGFEPGKTASPLNVFEELEKRYHGDENQPRPSLDFLNGARPHGVILREGEVLFIPRFWAHATAPDAASHPSIAINVFWRDLDPKSYSSRLDVYGNLDLWCYEHGRQKIQRAATILCGNSNTTDRKKQAAAISQYLQGREMSDQTMIPDVRSVGLDALRKLIRANLPTDVSRFYLLRLADELVKLVEQDGISVEDP